MTWSRARASENRARRIDKAILNQLGRWSGDMTWQDWISVGCGLLAWALVLHPAGLRAQAVSGHSDADRLSVVEGAVATEVTPYCYDLRRVAALAGSKERFAAIAGKPREGNFLETSLVLANWSTCALYGAATYTCDSHALNSAQEAEQAQARLLHEIKTCLGETWSEAMDRSSSGYVVLHNAARPISITLSTDETNDGRHVVRLIVFVRKN
jgi:hypothetical protein